MLGGTITRVDTKSLTLCREKVRTQKVASSMVSKSVTWIIPYVSVPLLGQYWSHFICGGWGNVSIPDVFQVGLAAFIGGHWLRFTQTFLCKYLPNFSVLRHYVAIELNLTEILLLFYFFGQIIIWEPTKAFCNDTKLLLILEMRRPIIVAVQIHGGSHLQSQTFLVCPCQISYPGIMFSFPPLTPGTLTDPWPATAQIKIHSIWSMASSRAAPVPWYDVTARCFKNVQV